MIYIVLLLFPIVRHIRYFTTVLQYSHIFKLTQAEIIKHLNNKLVKTLSLKRTVEIFSNDHLFIRVAYPIHIGTLIKDK